VDVFVTGTDTDVGKTVLSALLVTALDAGYWKPIQTGRQNGPTDRETVMRWTGLGEEDAPREAYIFDRPVSPHLAAREAGVEIRLDTIGRPRTAGRLIIEGAGGALVPISETELMRDLMRRLGAPVVVAARTTLGTINHTLLTIEALERRGITLLGVALVGEEDAGNRAAIEHYGRVPVVGRIPPLATIDRNALLDVFRRHFDPAVFRGPEKP